MRGRTSDSMWIHPGLPARGTERQADRSGCGPARSRAEPARGRSL